MIPPKVFGIWSSDFRDLKGWTMPRCRPPAPWLRQPDAYLEDKDMIGLVSAWAMARRRGDESTTVAKWYFRLGEWRSAAPAYAPSPNLTWPDHTEHSRLSKRTYLITGHYNALLSTEQNKTKQNDYIEEKYEYYMGHLQSSQLFNIAKKCCRRTPQRYSKWAKDDDINVNYLDVRIVSNPSRLATFYPHAWATAPPRCRRHWQMLLSIK